MQDNVGMLGNILPQCLINKQLQETNDQWCSIMKKSCPKDSTCIEKQKHYSFSFTRRKERLCILPRE